MRTFLPIAVLALLPVTATTPADAAPATRFLRAPNVVLFDSCDDYPMNFNLGIPSFAEDWDADVEVIGPDGNVADSTYLYGDSAYDDSGSDEMFLCGVRAGRYKLRADVTWYDYEYNSYEFSVNGNSFNVRYPRSRTALRGKRGSHLTFSVRVADERPRGYFPSDEYTDVILQQKKGARWVRVARSYLNEHGGVRFTRPNGPGREIFRAKADFASYEDVSDSVSTPVALR